MTHDELQAIKARLAVALDENSRDAGELAAEDVLNTDVPALIAEVERLRAAGNELEKLAAVVRERVRTWKHYAAEYGDAMGSEQMIRLTQITEILNPLADAATSIAKTMK